jgi:hypothetical protein
VAYHDNHTRERFHSPRESYNDTRTYRANLRDGNSNRGGYLGDRGNNRIAPNSARDQRQGRDDPALQRLDRRQAGQITTNSANVSNEREVQSPQPRAEQLRERMNSRTWRDSNNGRELGNPQNREQGNRIERQGTDIRQAERRTQNGQGENRNWENRLNNERSNRTERAGAQQAQPVQRTDSRIQQAQQQSRLERPTIQRLERTQSVERPQVQQVERREAPRVERVERAERSQRIERSGGDSDRQSGGRTELRGGRER